MSRDAKRKKFDINDLSLEPVNSFDESLYLSIFNCKRTMMHVKPLTHAQILSNFKYILQSPTEIYFSIKLNVTKQKVGVLGVSVDKKDYRKAELGVLLLPKVSPKGTSKFSMIKFINWLFQNTELEKIKYVIALKNKAAIRSCKTINVDFSCSNLTDDPQIGYIRKTEWVDKQIEGNLVNV